METTNEQKQTKMWFPVNS